jgi:uncharacterized protein YbaR (Trm112 family)
MPNAYSIAPFELLYKLTVLKEHFMIRIVCPICHAPLGANELEMAAFDGHACLVCPVCDNLLVTEDTSANASLPCQHKDVGDA